MPWSIREEEEDRGFNITTLYYVSAVSVFVYVMCVWGGAGGEAYHVIVSVCLHTLLSCVCTC